MNQVIPFPTSAKLVDAPLVVNPERNETVQCMGMHLVAGMTCGLDITNERDVIAYLMQVPERYRAKVICFYLDDAVYLAQQTVLSAMFGGR